MGTLLAIDLGLKTGMALYGRDGRLVWYRSKHFGNRKQLREGIRTILATLPDLELLVLEGGGPIATIWEAEVSRRRGPEVRRIGAETWRKRFLRDAERQSRELAKRSANGLARLVIEWSAADRPTSLGHDAAEAILIGFWGVLDSGWIEGIPAELDVLRRVVATPDT